MRWKSVDVQRDAIRNPLQRHRRAVRRLTPTEFERLQGFPDGHTAIQYRGKPAADGLRYRAIGNSMAVPVIEWIGRRIEATMKGMKFNDGNRTRQQNCATAGE